MLKKGVKVKRVQCPAHTKECNRESPRAAYDVVILSLGLPRTEANLRSSDRSYRIRSVLWCPQCR